MSRKSMLMYAALTTCTLSTLLSSTASAAHFGGGFGSRHPSASFHRSAATFHQPIAGTKKIDHRRDRAQLPLRGGQGLTVPGRSTTNPPWGPGCEACPPGRPNWHNPVTSPNTQLSNFAAVPVAVNRDRLGGAGTSTQTVSGVLSGSCRTCDIKWRNGTFLETLKQVLIAFGAQPKGSPPPGTAPAGGDQRPSSGGGGGGGNLDGGTPITVEAAQQMSGDGGNTDQPSDAGAHTDSGETGSADAATRVDGGA